jgi:histone H3/H4
MATTVPALTKAAVQRMVFKAADSQAMTVDQTYNKCSYGAPVAMQSVSHRITRQVASSSQSDCCANGGKSMIILCKACLHSPCPASMAGKTKVTPQNSMVTDVVKLPCSGTRFVEIGAGLGLGHA